MPDTPQPFVKQYEADVAAVRPATQAAAQVRNWSGQIARNLPTPHTSMKVGKLTADGAQNVGVQVNTGSPYTNIRLVTGQGHSSGNAVIVAFGDNDPQKPVGISVGGYLAP